MHWQGVAKIAAGVACISWRVGIEDPVEQDKFVYAFINRQVYGPSLVRALRHDRKSVIFSRECLLAVLRLALVEMSKGEADVDVHDAFTRACLSANTLLADEISPGAAQWDMRDLLPSELRSLASQQPEIIQEIGRTDAFIRWLETSDAIASKNRLPVLDDFLAFTGLTPDEYAAAAWVTMARCTSLADWDTVEQKGVAFELDIWLAGIKEQRCVRQFFALNGVDMERARAVWRTEPSLSYAAARPLWTHPIISATDGLFCVPAPGLLVNKFGNGFYFTLFDGYRSRSADGEDLHLRFAGYWSEFFEDYVYERFRDGYAKRPDVLVFPEQDLDGDKSTDVIIVENGDVMFVEVVAKRLNLEKSIVGLDDAMIQTDLDRGVRLKLKQLDRNVRAFRDGKLLPEIARKEGYRVFPIIVSPSEWPRAYTLGWYIPEVLKETGWLEGCEPVELLDVAEVERLEGLAADGDTLTQLLYRKHTFAHDRIQSLHNYIITRERSMLNASVPTWDAGADVARRVMGLASTWA
jgi:hypothetical protein